MADTYAYNGEQVKSLNDLAAEIHQINVDKGFWPENVEDRNVGEALCLIHSEITEAWDAAQEAIYDDKLTHYPGFQVEVADAAIRVLDLGGAHGVDFDGPSHLAEALNPLTSFTEDLMFIHKKIDDALEAHRKNATISHPSSDARVFKDVMTYKIILGDILDLLFQIAEKYDFDLLVIIEEKVEYNKGRPFKHGKSY